MSIHQSAGTCPGVEQPAQASSAQKARTWVAGALVATLSLLAGSSAAFSAEFATGQYILGFTSSLAGVTPPPGVYFQNDSYFYSSSLGAGRQLTFGPAVGVNIQQRTWINVETGIWITPVEVLGGNLGFTASLPFGIPRISPTIVVDFPRFNRTVGRTVTEENLNVADIPLQAFLGWHSGNFHWQLGVMGFVPSGTYDPNSFSNASLNRPAVDTWGSFTWLDAEKGHELSGRAGITWNGTNTINRYRSGDEFHLEWAAMQHFSPQFSLGVVGYFYDQFTADTGQGARLGPFKGRVVAVGGEADYSFKLGDLPVSTKLRVYREFDTVNRFQGTSGFLTIAVPLYVVQAKAPAPVVKANF
jgi:hypothetical protein